MTPRGARRRADPEVRFWSKVDKNGPVPEHRPDLGRCWLWTRGTVHGYGIFVLDGRKVGSHLLAYRWIVGSIPEGLQLDHLCRVRSCVNPAHLEPVTQKVNIIRGESPPARNAIKTECIHGHPLAGTNLYVHPKTGYRSCVKCRTVADLKYAERRRPGGPAERRPVRAA